MAPMELKKITMTYKKLSQLLGSFIVRKDGNGGGGGRRVGSATQLLNHKHNYAPTTHEKQTVRPQTRQDTPLWAVQAESSLDRS
jgi:hypothetical protein